MFYKYYLNDDEFSTYEDVRKAVIQLFPNISFPKDEAKFIAINWNGLGATFRREEYTPPAPSIGTLKADKKREISNARYQEETGGYQYDGHRIATDDRSKSLMLACVVAANMADSTYSLNWKCEGGEYITLDKQQLLTLSSGISQWVEELFAKEKTLLAQVDQATTKEEIEAIGWDNETVTD